MLEIANDLNILNELKSEKLDAKQSMYAIVKHEIKSLGKHQ